MNSFVNVNHAASLVGYWMFDFNYKKAFPLTLDSLNLTGSPSEVEGNFDVFETVFHTVRYTNNTGERNISD